ncbi:flagellar basal body L-ring protein FlgH [Pseudomonas aeruginosa]
MKAHCMIRSLPLVLAIASATGCAQLPYGSVVDKTPPTTAAAERPVGASNGSLFQNGYQPLFEDRRPRSVGDILTITLNEQVSASKSSASNASRGSSFSLTPKVVPSQIKKLGELETEVEGAAKFDGAGGSNAKNSFTGTITVTVMNVMPNGNLFVTGEKKIGINQGKEYIRFSGVVNPRTITAQNSVPSTSVADSRIEYVGDGYINEAQSMGWVQRILINISPF